MKYRFLGHTHIPGSNSLGPKHLNESFKYLLTTYDAPRIGATTVNKTESNPCSQEDSY